MLTITITIAATLYFGHKLAVRFEAKIGPVSKPFTTR